jgi:hypothetical protein
MVSGYKVEQIRNNTRGLMRGTVASLRVKTCSTAPPNTKHKCYGCMEVAAPYCTILSGNSDALNLSLAEHPATAHNHRFLVQSAFQEKVPAGGGFGSGAVRGESVL